MGLPAFHDYDSRRNNPGFPDTVIVGAKSVLWRELKTEVGKTSPEQDFWLAALREAGQDAEVWRPSDWPERVMRELRAIGRPRTPRPVPSRAEVIRRLQARGKGLVSDG